MHVHFSGVALSVNDAARELRGRLFNEKRPEIDRAESEHTRAAFILDTSRQCNVYTYCCVFPRTIDSRHKETAWDRNTPCIQPVSPSDCPDEREMYRRRYRILSTYLGIGD